MAGSQLGLKCACHRLALIPRLVIRMLYMTLSCNQAYAAHLCTLSHASAGATWWHLQRLCILACSIQPTLPTILPTACMHCSTIKPLTNAKLPGTFLHAFLPTETQILEAARPLRNPYLQRFSYALKMRVLHDSLQVQCTRAQHVHHNNN